MLNILEPTLFSFPSRHHTYNSNDGSSFSVRFNTPTGLHPVLRLTFTHTQLPPAPSCSLHTYSVIPSSLLIDKYQMSSANLFASNNLRALRSLDGETDLEAPDWTISKWGSAMLLELAPPPANPEGEWHADKPMHLRYQHASSHQSDEDDETGKDKVVTSMPWPVVFWACPAEEGTKMSTNPFDRVNLGYDGLFGPRTMFYHVPSATNNGSLMESIIVPVLDPRQAVWIECGTVGSIILGVAWVCWTLFRPLPASPDRGHAGKEVKAE